MPPSVSAVATSRSVARTSSNGWPSAFSRGANTVTTPDHHAISASFGLRAVSNRRVIAASPMPVAVPRNARSSWRTWSNQSSLCVPANTKGCLAMAKMLDAENRLQIASTSASASVPGGVCSKGIPALSSTSIPQRRNCPATRTANSRSGVISATRFCAVSNAPRIRTAMALASCALSSASNHLACGRLLRSGGSSCQYTLCSGRQNISEIVVASGTDLAVGRTAISLRSMPISSSKCFK